MSCPGVAGTLALIRQYFREVNPITGMRANVRLGPLGDGRGPSGALLKAVLISSARPLTGEYTYRREHNGERKRGVVADSEKSGFLQGHGRPQLDGVLRLGGKSKVRLFVFDRHAVGHGDKAHRFVFRVRGGGEWRAVLVYTDAPGPIQEAWQTGRVLVNDLDLVGRCSQIDDCDAGGLESMSRRDNVETLPRFDGRKSHVRVKRDTTVHLEVRAHAVESERQPYSLVMVGRKIEFEEDKSTGANWKPDWSRSVKLPGSMEKEKRDFTSSPLMLTVALAVIGVLVVIGVLTATIVYCRGKRKACSVGLELD